MRLIKNDRLSVQQSESESLSKSCGGDLGLMMVTINHQTKGEHEDLESNLVTVYDDVAPKVASYSDGCS